MLNELQQERKDIDKIDLTRDLLVKGYTEGEINLAFSWIFNHLKSPPQDRVDSDIDYTDQFEDYPEFERLIISPDAYGFLLQLIQLGVIKENDIEMFIERAIAYGKDDISVDIIAVSPHASSDNGLHSAPPRCASQWSWGQ